MKKKTFTPSSFNYAYEQKVEIKTVDSPDRKYSKIVDLSKKADIRTARDTMRYFMQKNIFYLIAH